jgi:hypothetical protein
MVPVDLTKEEGQAVLYLDCQNAVISSRNPPERPRDNACVDARQALPARRVLKCAHPSGRA